MALFQFVVRGRYNISYCEPGGITKRMLVIAKFSIGMTENILYSLPVDSEEELDIALKHYSMVKKWNL